MTKQLDIVFISYEEPNADENFDRIKSRFPQVKRVHGIAGLHEAFRRAASCASTPFFFTVDGDNSICSDFNFTYDTSTLSLNHIVVWRTRNPINELEYGYGGIKLFGSEAAAAISEVESVDVIGVSGQRVIFESSVASLTMFNTDPYNTWKAGFRECAMLAQKGCFRTSETDAEEKIKIWTTVGAESRNGRWAIRGAKDGLEFGKCQRDDPRGLQKINDFQFLFNFFQAKYQIIMEE